MTPQELKNSILQLAIQGKLVEQRSEEGTAEELFKQIQAEKQALIKAGKIKKEKPLPEIAEDEKPFDIPESWKWIRFGETGTLFSGFAFKSDEYSSDGVQVVRISDLGEDEILDKDAAFYPYSERLSQYEIRKDSFLICQTGSIGKMAWVHDDTPRYLNQRVGMFVGYAACHTPFLWYFLHTYYVLEQWISAKTSTNGNIKNSDITDLIFPLPPLAEQKRIVAKIEELLPLIDRYEEAWTKLEAFNKRFPGDMQKSLLQMAIQGKLVKQRPEEGTGEELYAKIQAKKQALVKSGKIKKEKAIPEIADEEKPFDIPDSWIWTSINEIAFVTKLAGFEYTEYMTNAISETGEVPIVRAKNIKPNCFIENTNEFISLELSKQLARCALDERCLLMTFIGAGIGEVAIFENKKRHHLAPNVAKIVPHIDINDYLLFYLMSFSGRQQIFQYMKQTAQPSLSMETIRRVLVPLPPIAEQKRIVAKLEELLPLCERLK